MEILDQSSIIKQNLAPILLFVYNRPEHTLKTLNALKNNYLSNESIIYIYADGIKDSSDFILQAQIEQVRNIIKSVDGFSNVKVIERAKNWGLSSNIINGISEVLQYHDKVIVIEDDIVTSPYFLKFMNNALNYYSENDMVGCISGYIYPIDGLPNYFFVKGADCWGWGTWKRAWNVFEEEGSILYSQLKFENKQYDFDFYGSYPYTKMLSDQINNLNDSWAIRWHASCYLKGKLCLYPNRTFVKNIGFDGSGTHCITSESFNSDVTNELISMSMNYEVKESIKAKKIISKYFQKLNDVDKTHKKSIKKIIKSILLYTKNLRKPLKN